MVIALLAGCTKSQPVQAKKESGPVSVTAATVAVREVQRVVESVGTLFPYEEAIISAEIEGRIDEVKADLGDTMTPGQVLVHISEEEQKYLLQQTEAVMRQALERLGLKDENDRIVDVRNAPEPRRAQADLTDADQRLKRIKTLHDQGISSDADLDQAQARYQSALAAYDSSLNQARNMIQMVEQYKAQMQLQRKKMRDTSVRAPFAGLVKDRQVSLGQYVRPNTPLFTLVKINPIRLRIEVPERMAPWVRVGQVADVSLEAFEGQVFKGKLWRVSPTVEQSKRTFVVEALIDNPAAALKPGSYARARIPTDKVEKIRLAPARALNYVFGSNKAYLLKDNVIEARDVKLGDRFGTDVEILEGLEPGDRIASSNLTRLDTGTKVEVQTTQSLNR